MEPRTRVDLTNLSFEEFVSFIFDHDAPPDFDSEKYDPWYFHVEPEFDPEKVCGYYMRLFREPEFLPMRYTKSQLDQGFWAIHGSALDCSVSRIIEDSDVPLLLRVACIRSMNDLFERLFARETLEGTVEMWWDSLCYDWHCGNRSRERGGEDSELQEVYFETLAKVLAIESDSCQYAALHGLGHLHHPKTKELIEKFIDVHPSLTQERREYALAASIFEVQ